MSKRTPVRTETIDGTEYPVYLITCAESGVEFEHVQVGRGRPPVYSPEVRAARAEKVANPGKRGPKRLRASIVTLGFTTDEGVPAEGERALFVPAEAHRNWAAAVRHARLFIVKAVNGDTATLTTEGLAYEGEVETLDAPVKNLVRANFVN